MHNAEIDTSQVHESQVHEKRMARSTMRVELEKSMAFWLLEVIEKMVTPEEYQAIETKFERLFMCADKAWGAGKDWKEAMKKEIESE